MGLLFTVALILLGLIGARGAVAEKLPASQKYIDPLKSNQQIIGIIGFVLGIIALFRWVEALAYLKLYPINALFGLALILIELALSFIFGLDAIRPTLKGQGAQFMLKAETFRSKLLPYQKILSIIAIVCGALRLLFFIAIIIGLTPFMMY